MEPKTLQELVHYIGIFGRKTASQIKNNRDDYDRYSFDEYQSTAKAVAAYLEHTRRLRKDDMVVIYSDNRPEWMMAYLGIVYNGLWAVPLDAKLTDFEVKNLLADCGAKVMFISKSLYDNISGEPEIMNQIQEFIIFDEPRGIRNRKVRHFRDIVDEGQNIEVTDHPISEEDVASLIYTSGTTGSPKGVLLMHRNFAHQLRSLSRSVPITVEDTELCLLPLHHTFEFSVELTCLYCGATVTYAESLRPNKMLANIQETGVTIMVGVPLIFEKLYEGIMRNIRALSFPLKPFVMGLFYFTGGLNKVTGNAAGKRIFGFLRKKAGLDGVKYMISGAAPLNYKVAAGFDTLGLTLINGYGLTEASPVIAVNRLDRKIKNESVGIPIPGAEVKIDNPDVENQGEILTRSASVMKGYFRNPQATAEVLDSDGWLHTGDIGTLDAEGYLHVTGRKKNIIVTPGGKNVYPEEIEDKLTESPFILEALIVGIPEAEHSKGETIYCYVVPNYEYFDNYCSVNGQKLTDDFVEQTVDQAVREVSAQLADYKKIKGWRIRREEFQKTSTKKIKRYLFSGKDFLES